MNKCFETSLGELFNRLILNNSTKNIETLPNLTSDHLINNKDYQCNRIARIYLKITRRFFSSVPIELVVALIGVWLHNLENYSNRSIEVQFSKAILNKFIINDPFGFMV
ncbi:hypothetical protein BpHYR1_003963 [Brachionus plicatilis]|uniref:Uncharacterized protein n=1 Tax=Brachionus plicatilis TaxID=10195 RepID=A0A3M7RXT0_BRAPC|nr:hypothetical protein BpHYR1_003963 [Brachionus plicatilis]